MSWRACACKRTASPACRKQHRAGKSEETANDNKTIDDTFDNGIARTTAALKNEEFGILTEIDIAATLKAKLGIEFRPYRILGACNPPLAYQALIAEDKIGTMLPCNVIVQELGPGRVEIAAINPLVAMDSVGNPALSKIAETVAWKLQRAIAAI